jgi:hypothetical protein
MQQTRTSGVSITSMVLGIVSMVCVPFLGVVSVVLGVLGLRQVKRSEGAVTGRGFAITGIVLGVINVVLSGVMAVLVVLAMRFADARPTLDTQPTYRSLIGEGLSGSGFHFDWDGERYIACSLHQFDGGTPGEMISFDLETIPVFERVHAQADVQILTYAEATLAAADPLRYMHGVGVRRNERVLVMADNEAVWGTVTAAYPDANRLRYLTLDHPRPLQGLSGSAIVNGATGTVVGVLITGDEARGIVGFELLDLPEPLRGPGAKGP